MRISYFNRVVSALFIACGAVSARANIVTWATSAGGNGNSYNLILDSSRTWDQANDVVGVGHLVTIGSAAEQSFVESLLASSSAPTGSYWMGLKEGSTEGKYGWVRAEPLNYTHWDAGEPNNGAGDEMVGGILWSNDATSSRRGKWNDLPTAGYPNVPDGTPAQADLLRAGYIVETEATGGPKPIPLPAALLATPLALLVAGVAFRRFNRVSVAV